MFGGEEDDEDRFSCMMWADHDCCNVNQWRLCTRSRIWFAKRFKGECRAPEAWKKALEHMRDLANLEREVFDIRRVSTGIRIAVNSAPAGFLVALAPLASITIGMNSVVNEDRFKSLAPTVDFHMFQTYLEDM